MAANSCVIFCYASVVANMFVLDVLYAKERYSLPASVNQDAVSRIQLLVVE